MSQNNIYGFGTHRLKGEECFKAVTYALKAGYNLIDTAEKYNNSLEIGKAIKASRVKREDIIIVHKLTDVLEFSRTQAETCEKIYGYLNELDTNYIDILLMHGPSPRYHPNPEEFRKSNLEVWKAMHSMKDRGRVRSIGVSNFHKHQIMYLIEETGFIPDYLEIEFNVGNVEQMVSLVDWCRNMGIKVIAYSPIAAGDIKLIENSVEYKNYYAEHPDVTPAEYALRFCLLYNTIPIPRSSNPEHIFLNLKYLKKGAL